MNGQGRLKCLGDSGASCTTMSRAMADQIQLEYRAVKPAEKLGLAGGDHCVSLVGKTKARVEIVLNTNGSITVRDTPIWVIAEAMDEVLLGDDVLSQLGINVHEQLLQRGGVEIDYKHAGSDMESFPYLGGDDGAKIEKILRDKVENAIENGLPKGQKDKWTNLLLEHIDEFRTIMGLDAPAKVAPLKVHWDEEKAKRVRPVRIAYNEKQKEFLDYYAKTLINKGYAYVNPNARFVSEALVLPKVAEPKVLEEDWRLVVNLKKANAACDPTYWPLPTMEDVQQYLKGAKYFIALDLKNGYWQIRLHTESQELFSFCTHREVLTPTRIPQGCTDAVMYFTSVIMKVFEEKIYKGILPWLDDLLLYGGTIEEVFELLRWVLERARMFGLKFSPKKLTMLIREIEWCGKMITSEGVHVDPKKRKALGELNLPNNGAELMQFIHAANWIRCSLPEFTRVFSPLQEWLNSLLSNGRRTSKRAKAIALTWNDERRNAFEQAKELIRNAVTQAHPKEQTTLCLFTDASDRHWGAILTQIEEYDTAKPIWEQQMEPLYFLSGSFRGAQLGWSTPDKEGFAIVESVERLRYLLIRPKGFRLFTDHRNLKFMYGASSTLKLNVKARLDRWALKLQGYRFDIEHIAGEHNLWADLLSRWGANADRSMEAKRTCLKAVRKQSKRAERREAKPVCEPMSALEWPTADSIRCSQRNAKRPKGVKLTERDGFLTHRERVWIPDADRTMRKQLMVIAHYGISGHNGIEGTMQKLKAKFYWESMSADVERLIADCILCRCGKATVPTRLHYGKKERAERPNQHLHFDYYYVGDSTEGYKYLLVLRDGFSRLVLLKTAVEPTAVNTAYGVMEWIGLFGLPEKFYSDNGSHFRNAVMREVVRHLGIKHEFSTVYCAWSNGLIERVMRDLKVLFKILLIDKRLGMDQWPRIVPSVMFALNQRASRVLAGNAPVTVHTGIPTRGLLSFVCIGGKEVSKVQWKGDMIAYLDALSEQLNVIHEDVTKATEQKNAMARKGVEPLPEFEIGDYVLYCYRDRVEVTAKHDFQWRGPYQVVDIKHEHVYAIKDLVSGHVIEAHITRMSFYSTAQLHVQGSLVDLISRQGLKYEVSKLEAIVWCVDSKQHRVKVHWRGFDEMEATYEPFRSLMEQIPKAVWAFIDEWKRRDEPSYAEFYAREKSFLQRL